MEKKLIIALLFQTALLADGCCTTQECPQIECCTTSSCCDEDWSTCKDILMPFSQGENIARRYAGVAYLQNLKTDWWNFHADVALEYQQNFNSDELGSYFFPNCSNRIIVGEDRTLTPTTITPADVRGSDLGLSETFSGQLTIYPSIRNLIFEPTFYVGFDRWVQGLWFDISVPFASTRWDLRCCEVDNSFGSTQFVPFISSTITGTLAQNSMKNAGFTTALLGSVPTPTWSGPGSDIGLTTSVGASSICKAFSGQTTWGDKTSGLGAARILCCEGHRTGVADVPVQLGYNIIRNERGYLGAYIRGVIAAGGVENRRSIFDPMVGYGRWQLGAGLQGRLQLYERPEDTVVSLFGNFYMTHIFAQDQCRVFDIKNRGCWSRYLLMKEADAHGNYTGRLVNFVDIFTACVNSKFNWNLDGLLFFNVIHKGWSFDIGYEVKARARESFDCDTVCLCAPCDEGSRKCDDDCCTSRNIGSLQYGVKGPQIIGGIGTKVFDASDTTINTLGTTLSTSLINGSNFGSYLDFERTKIPGALANKVWAHFGYLWDRVCPIAAGVGVEVDFGNKNQQPKLWGIWGKVTVAYN